MKKLILLLLTVLVISVVGCSLSSNNNGTNLISDYSFIGEQHNKMLEQFYGLGQQRKIDIQSRNESFNDFFGIDEETIYISLDNKNSIRSVSSDISIVEELNAQNYISESANHFISQVESILQNPGESLEDTQKAIYAIENEALQVVEEECLLQFMSYAETAKYSLSFWYNNYEYLEDEYNSTRGLLDLWNTYKHKLAMAAASDAAGAAAGALIGAQIGSTIPGVGTATGATVGAVVAGAASSAKGFETDSICVVIPLTQIQKELQ